MGTETREQLLDLLAVGVLSKVKPTISYNQARQAAKVCIDSIFAPGKLDSSLKTGTSSTETSTARTVPDVTTRSPSACDT